MIIVKNDIVTTNLRLPRQDWLMIKALAAEEGKSFNEYINWLVEDVSKRMMVFGEAANMRQEGRKLKLNEDDKIIYGL